MGKDEIADNALSALKNENPLQAREELEKLTEGTMEVQVHGHVFERAGRKWTSVEDPRLLFGS